MKKSIVLFVLAFLIASVCISQSNAGILFREGDRITFVGNSITHGIKQWGSFHNYIMLYYATRYPNLNLSFYNAGIWGDNANSFLQRMDNDILVNKSNWYIVMAGMNDVRRHYYIPAQQGKKGLEDDKQRALDDYRGYLEQVIQRLLKEKANVIIQMPSIYDQTGSLPSENLIGVNDAMQKCTVIIGELAAKYKIPVVDYWSLMNDINRRIQKEDSTATIISGDRIHPGTNGHFVMAYQFLKTIPPSQKVAVVEIDNNKVRSSENCTVGTFSRSNNTISFSYLAKSLPFPIAIKEEEAIQLVPFIEDFNIELFKVASLAEGSYTLSLDNNAVGVYTSTQLSSGINLAINNKTPQYQQALKVAMLTDQYRQQQVLLRVMKFIELNYLPKEVHKDYTKAKSLIEDWINTGNSNYNDHKNRFDLYLLNKPKQKELEEELDKLRKKIYEVNKPASHLVRLLKN